MTCPVLRLNKGCRLISINSSENMLRKLASNPNCVQMALHEIDFLCYHTRQSSTCQESSGPSKLAPMAPCRNIEQLLQMHDSSRFAEAYAIDSSYRLLCVRKPQANGNLTVAFSRIFIKWNPRRFETIVNGNFFG
jgi:hypothetical protein